MDCLPDWNSDVGVEFQRKPLGLENELMELLWQNGEVVLHSQTHRKQTYEPSKSKQQLHKNDLSDNLIQDDDTISWIDCPIIDESFDKDFCANLLSETPPPPSNPVEPNKLSGKFDGEKDFKSGTSYVNHHVSPTTSQRRDCGPPPLPPPRFVTSDVGKTGNLQIPVKRRMENGAVNKECSRMTIGSSHCASNQVVNEVDMSWASSCGIGSRNQLSAGVEENYGRKISRQCESTERETLGQAITSSSGGSGSSFWKTSSQSNDTNRHKRKTRDVEESECRSDATELESAARKKLSQKSGTTRRSRVAEVHNLSERRRRDRINEKMRALQELIPHSSKSDKASMLDEAIEYMKSLQLQLQLMWMGSGMAPMMLSGMQHYMSRVGMGMGPPMLPAIQNLMRLSRLPFLDQVAAASNQAPVGHGVVNYQNQMQNSGFAEQYANYMGFHAIPNTTQATNMLNFGSQNQASAPQGNGNGAI